MYVQGLGSTWKQLADGTWLDCDTWAGVLYSACWNPFNPQLAGPQASNPATPSNPITDVALGIDQTGSGQPISAIDYASATVGNPISLAAIGAVAVVGLLAVVVILPALAGGRRR